MIQDKDKEELEKCFLRERNYKDSAIEKSNKLEKRLLEVQAEILMHRERTEKNDYEKKTLERRLKDLSY